MPKNLLGSALKGFKRGEIAMDEEEPQDDTQEEGLEPMEDPRSESSNGETIYLDKELFPGACKVGEKVVITGTVESLGSKYGVVPEGIQKVAENGEEQE